MGLYREYLFLKGMFPTWDIKYHKSPDYISIGMDELTDRIYMYKVLHDIGFYAYLFDREYIVLYKYFKDIYSMKRISPLQVLFYPKGGYNENTEE